MLELLTMIALLIRPLYSVILTVTGIQSTSGQMGILYAAVAAVTFIYVLVDLFKNKWRMKYTFWVVIEVILFVLACLVFTVIYYNAFSELKSTILSFGSETICIMLLAYELSQKNNIKNFGKWIPFFIVIVTAVTMYSVFWGKRALNGLTNDTNGINYQNAAYYAANILGLNLFYLANYDDINKFKFIDKIKILFYIIPFVEIVILINAGGRGGLLLGAALIGFYFIKNIRKILKKKVLFLSILGVVCAAVAFVLIFKRDLVTIGFSRLMNFFSNKSTTIRLQLLNDALEIFKSKPLFGYGVGSIWVTLGFYAHDMFIDLLCETGIIGTLIVTAVLVLYVIKQYACTKADKNDSFFFMIFICGFVMALFSGYYLSIPMLWFPVVYVFCKRA